VGLSSCGALKHFYSLASSTSLQGFFTSLYPSPLSPASVPGDNFGTDDRAKQRTYIKVTVIERRNPRPKSHSKKGTFVHFQSL
jgi:hypothetical protein